MRPYVSEVLVGTSWIDDRLFFDPRSKKPELNGWGFAKKLRREHFDAVVLLTNSFHRILGLGLGPSSASATPATSARSFSRTSCMRRWPAANTPQSTLDAYLQIAYALGCPKESTRIELATTEADECAADDVWQRLASRPTNRSCS